MSKVLSFKVPKDNGENFGQRLLVAESKGKITALDRKNIRMIHNFLLNKLKKKQEC